MKPKNDETKKPKTLMEFLHSEHEECAQVKAEIGTVFIGLLERFTPEEISRTLHEMLYDTASTSPDSSIGEKTLITTLIIDAFLSSNSFVNKHLN